MNVLFAGKIGVQRHIAAINEIKLGFPQGKNRISYSDRRRYSVEWQIWVQLPTVRCWAVQREKRTPDHDREVESLLEMTV
jgi:hypothetical protein